jgi:hypothetical protein
MAKGRRELWLSEEEEGHFIGARFVDFAQIQV